MDPSAASGSGTKIDGVDEGILLKKFAKEETSEDEYGEKKKLSNQSYESEIKGRCVDDKEHLLEKFLKASDVSELNRLIIATDPKEYSPVAAVLGEITRLLEFEDEDGKLWKFNCSYVSQRYEFTGGWRSYVKEKQLGAGDFVCFRRSRTDSSRRFISCIRREIDPTAHRQLRLHEVNMTGFNPVLVIFCGDNQDSEETYFISYIFNELCLHGFSPLRYDLTKSMVTGNQEMLYSSRVGIMIFSENYTRSRQYLDEIIAITHHFKAKDLVPVYFKVSLSDVRNQSGSLGGAFLQLGKSVQASQVQKWREAMIKITSINGYLYAKGDEVMLAKNIVRDVCLLLSSETYSIKIPLESILPLLDCPQPSALQVVGLWGMAGIGKTTIAREIFRTQAERYDVCYFLPDFHLMCQTKGLNHLRDEFFSKIFGEEKVCIDACDTKLSCTKDRLLDKRVLIILDGVTNARDVEVLVGGFGWFSGGHTIILTSRNKQVLVQCNVKELYEIPKLSEAESLSFFGQHATEKNQKGKMTLISELVNYANGIPLALRVLGSSVQDKCVNNEKEHLRKLRQHPPIEIQDAFRKSFDGLDENEKNIFLDLACFFRGEKKDHVVNILDGCDFFTDLGICGLIDESLISLVENRIEMPNIFQDLGQFVVRQENEEAGKRSRLWDSSDISDVLMSNSGTEAIEGIFLDMSELPFELNPTVFERMHRLRLLKLHCPTSESDCKVCIPQGLHSFPDELRLLHWERYPLGSLPRNLNPKNLVELNMPYSNVTKLWKGTKNLEKLKRIILSHSRELTKFPRLSKAVNLEYIDFEGCTSLVKVNSSILHLHKLTFLSLKDCSRLRVMPSTVHLESLEVLNLSGCSELEDIGGFSANLTELYLAGTSITEIPSSIVDLTRLVTLDLMNCHSLMNLKNLKALVTLSTNLSEALLGSASNSYFPERPGQPECQYYMQTGDCKFGYSCEFHHPRDIQTFAPGSFLSPIGLPLRPGYPVCAYYFQTGTCSYGPSCNFDHPIPTDKNTSSVASVTHHLNPLEFSSSVGDSSSSRLSTKKPRIQKSPLVDAPAVSETTNAFLDDKQPDDTSLPTSELDLFKWI